MKSLWWEQERRGLWWYLVADSTDTGGDVANQLAPAITLSELWSLRKVPAMRTCLPACAAAEVLDRWSRKHLAARRERDSRHARGQCAVTSRHPPLDTLIHIEFAVLRHGLWREACRCEGVLDEFVIPRIRSRLIGRFQSIQFSLPTRLPEDAAYVVAAVLGRSHVSQNPLAALGHWHRCRRRTAGCNANYALGRHGGIVIKPRKEACRPTASVEDANSCARDASGPLASGAAGTGAGVCAARRC